MFPLRKKEGESTTAFLRRFSKKIYQSGVLKEVKKKQFKRRKPSLRARKLSALYKVNKKREIIKAQRSGLF